MRTLLITVSLWFFIQTCAGQQVTPSGQTSGTPAQPPTEAAATFRSQSESVLVPVVVLAKHDQYVSGLSKDAFEIRENGKEQTVASIEEMHPRENPPDSDSAENSHSNLRLDPAYQPQLTILLLDFFNATPIQRTDAKDQLIHFLSKDFQGGGTFSLLCMTSDGLRVLRTFTEDKTELVRILQNLNTEGYSLKEHQDSIRWTLDQVRQIAQAYKGVPGRKTMVWFSGNIPYPHVDSLDDREQQLRDDFDETRKSLLSANIAVYPMGLLAATIGESQIAQDVRQFDLNGRPRGPSVDVYQSLHYFAYATGGTVCVENNHMGDCLNEAVQDSRSYYMLSFPVKPDDKKPGWRKLEVKLKGVKAEVRAREGFFYEDRSARISAKVSRASEITALTSPLSQSSVRMNVRVLGPDASQTPASDKKTIQFLLTIPLSTLNIDSSRPKSLDLEVGAIALDKHVKEAGEFLRPVAGNPPPEALRQLAKEGVRLRAKLDLSPGVYDLRFFARDNSTGLVGTVVFPLEVK